MTNVSKFLTYGEEVYNFIGNPVLVKGYKHNIGLDRIFVIRLRVTLRYHIPYNCLDFTEINTNKFNKLLIFYE